MYLVCGEALFDVFMAPVGTAHNRLTLDAIAGGSPFNVAVGLARLGTRCALFTGISSDPMGQQLRQVLSKEGVEERYLVPFDAPTTLAMVALGDNGVPSFPDPTADGRFEAEKIGAGPDDPKLKAAMGACREVSRGARIMIGG